MTESERKMYAANVKLVDKNNMLMHDIIEAERKANTAIKLLDDLLKKPKISKDDIKRILEKIEGGAYYDEWYFNRM